MSKYSAGTDYSIGIIIPFFLKLILLITLSQNSEITKYLTKKVMEACLVGNDAL